MQIGCTSTSEKTDVQVYFIYGGTKEFMLYIYYSIGNF